MSEYRLYGIQILSQFSLGVLPSKSEVFFSLETHWHREHLPITGEWIGSSFMCYPDGVPVLSVFRKANHYVLDFAHVGQIQLSRDTAHVYALDFERMRPFFLGRALAFFLELHGNPVIHGSCVLIGGRAFALVGPKGFGKSTLSFGLNRLGFPCLADDLVTLYGNPAQVLPGPGNWRLWPDVGQLTEDFANQPKVHPDFEKREVAFDPQSDRASLGGILFLEPPDGTDLNLASVPPARALTRALAESFQVELLEKMEYYPHRVAKLAGVLESLPCFQLSFPRGMQHLNSVCQYIADHLSGERHGSHLKMAP
ncbi:MAG: hypothetical protein H6510_01450 [Acidobacteria bacterium]|nr:hypothetical protein [Acidobacteriota bacterium]